MYGRVRFRLFLKPPWENEYCFWNLCVFLRLRACIAREMITPLMFWWNVVLFTNFQLELRSLSNIINIVFVRLKTKTRHIVYYNHALHAIPNWFVAWLISIAKRQKEIKVHEKILCFEIAFLCWAVAKRNIRSYYICWLKKKIQRCKNMFLSRKVFVPRFFQ